jgi:hypothetical protein
MSNRFTIITPGQRNSTQGATRYVVSTSDGFRAMTPGDVFASRGGFLVNHAQPSGIVIHQPSGILIRQPGGIVIHQPGYIYGGRYI